jgi:hypothetical protein
MNINGRVYDEGYISDLISDMLNAEGKPETEQTVRETRQWLLTSSYLNDIYKESEQIDDFMSDHIIIHQ